MAKLTITGTNGVAKTVEGPATMTVMQIIRNAGFDDLLAQCGGCLSCATCHVIVHPDDFPRVGPPSDEENDLLDSSEVRTTTSRLSCQIPFGAGFDGLRITIADEG